MWDMNVLILQTIGVAIKVVAGVFDIGIVVGAEMIQGLQNLF